MGHGGPCGFRVWDKEANEYCSEAYLIDTAGSLYEIGILADRSTLFFSKQERYVIEMASGFKCEDGKPVYAGDVVSVHGNIALVSTDPEKEEYIGVIKFVKGEWVVGNKYGYASLPQQSPYILEKLGDIHHLDKLRKKHKKMFDKATYREVGQHTEMIQ